MKKIFKKHRTRNRHKRYINKWNKIKINAIHRDNKIMQQQILQQLYGT